METMATDLPCTCDRWDMSFKLVLLYISVEIEKPSVSGWIKICSRSGGQGQLIKLLVQQRPVVVMQYIVQHSLTSSIHGAVVGVRQDPEGLNPDNPDETLSFESFTEVHIPQ